nr:Lrp/AsnC family transcriptional regulator [Haloterrigena turkmenica]
MLVKGPCGLFSRLVQGHRMDDTPLDDVDRSILHQLQLNARQTDTEIAEKVDVTSTTVRNRLDKLEDKGVIRGYYPEIDYEEAGYPLHVMFVCTVNPNNLKSMAEQILDIRGVVTTRDLLGGERNIHVEIVAGSVREIEDIRNELADLGMTINSSEIISETQVQSWDHFYPRTSPDANQDDDTDDGSVTDQR